jgi:hypothetical protein
MEPLTASDSLLSRRAWVAIVVSMYETDRRLARIEKETADAPTSDDPGTDHGDVPTG